MKIKNITDIDGFFKVIDSCQGKVELITGEGDRLNFYEHHATLRSIKRTPVDHVVGHISLVFELVFPESVRIVKEQGYLEKLLHFESRNAVTNAQFAELRAEMERYLKGR